MSEKTASIPESWKISEQDLQAAWDKNSALFAEFKEHFQKNTK